MDFRLFAIIYLGSNILYMYTLYLFMDRFLEIRRASRFLIFVAFIGYYLLNSTLFLTQKHMALNVIVNLACLCGVSFLYKTGIGKRLMGVVISYFVAIVIEDTTAVVISWYYHIPMESALNEPFYGILGMIVSKLVLLITVQVFAGLMERFRHTEPALMISYWVAVFLIPLGSIYVLHTVFINIVNHPEESPIAKAAAIAILLAINSLVFYLYHRAMESEKVKYEQNSILLKNEQEMAQVALSHSFQENIRTLNHDMKNHNAMIYSLAEQGDTNGILRYIRSLNENLEISKSPINSGNPVIDSIINHWQYLMGQEQIKSEQSISVNAQINVDDIDITSILGNLLDNAIEASKAVPVKDRLITIRIEELKGTLLIIVTNAYQKSAMQAIGGRLKTTKKQASGHGLGLRSIQRSVKKYKGLFEYTYDDSLSAEYNLFKAKILLYL